MRDPSGPEASPRAWPGISCDVVFANFAEVVATKKYFGGAWRKAALVPAKPGYVLVAPDVRAQSGRLPTSYMNKPACTIVPAASSGSLTWDLLADDEGWSGLIAGLRQRPTPTSRLRVWAQIHSAGLEEVVRRLKSDGFDVDHSTLPAVSGGTVAHWNTKIGGRELLRANADLARHLPDATVAANLPEVVAIVAASPESGFVVKPDHGLGGTGIVVFGPDPDRSLDSTIARVEGQYAKLAGSLVSGHIKSYADIHGPFLVERLIGSTSENLSPTVDLIVERGGTVACVAIALQILDGGTCYRGSRSVPAALSGASGDCVRLAGQAGEILARKGYVGLCNVDFVITAAGEVRLVELNLRQSAPLDQSLLIRRMVGNDWAATRSFHADEAYPGAPDLVDAAAQALGWNREHRQGFSALALATDHAERTSLLLSGPLDGAFDEALVSLSRAVSG